MPGGVIEVGGRESSGWWRRLAPMPWLGAMAVALRRGRSAAGASPSAGLPAGFAPRGVPALVAEPDGEPRCVACGWCAAACPTRCLAVVPARAPEDPTRVRPARFALDPGRCVLCGLCEEACPEAAIVLSPVRPEAILDAATRTLEMPDLLVPADRLGASFDRLRGSATVDRDGAAPGTDA